MTIPRFTSLASSAWLIGVAAVFAACRTAGADPDWSRDGKWLAFMTQAGDSNQKFQPGWWSRPDAAFDSPRAFVPATFNLWVCRVEDRQCWRLATSDLGFSTPVWSPDGQELAYVRLSDGSDDRVLVEVVLQHGFEPPRVLASCEMKTDGARGLAVGLGRMRLAARNAAPAWSPRGTYLAAPFESLGMAIFRASDGSRVASFPDASFASWSPDERRLAFTLPGETAGYHVTAPDLGPARLAIATNFAAYPVVWEPNGTAFHAIVWRELANAPGTPPNVADLQRYDLKRERPEVVRSVLTKRPSLTGGPAHIYFPRLAGTRSLFVLTSGYGHTSEALEFALDQQAVPRRHTILERDLEASDPSVSPDGRTVALRVGPDASSGVPATYDLKRGELRLILPDHDTQLRAAHTVIELMLDSLEIGPRPDGTKASLAPVRLPSPATLAALQQRDSRFAERFDRLARMGKDIIAAAPADSLDLRQRRAVVEARMFLTYISADYAAALAATESLDPLLDSSRDRLALTLVRAQCLIGSRKFAPARQLLEFLQQKVGRAARDETPPEEDEQKRLAVAVQRLLDELADAQK